MKHYRITLWPFSNDSLSLGIQPPHDAILKVLFLFSFLGRNTPGEEANTAPHPQLLSNYFSYPVSPAIPLKAFLSLISPDGPTFFLLLLLRCICLPVYLMSSSLLHDCLRLKMIARVQRRIHSSSLCNFYFKNKYYL